MWKFLGFILLFNVVLEPASCMTRVQLKKTMAVMKNSCMPKTGVTEDQVGKIEEGVFIEDPKVMRYITCIYKTIQVVKNDKLSKELTMKQVDILYPQEMKAPVKAAIEKCMPTQDNYSDPYEGIFFAAKCLYETDPPNFIFP